MATSNRYDTRRYSASQLNHYFLCRRCGKSFLSRSARDKHKPECKAQEIKK